MKRGLACAATVILLGCGGAQENDAAEARTQRQRDSAIAESNLPTIYS